MLFITFLLAFFLTLALLDIIESAIVSWQGPQRPVAGYMDMPSKPMYSWDEEGFINLPIKEKVHAIVRVWTDCTNPDCGICEYDYYGDDYTLDYYNYPYEDVSSSWDEQDGDWDDVEDNEGRVDDWDQRFNYGPWADENEVVEEIMCHSDDSDDTTMVRHPAHHGAVVHVRTNWLGMDTTRARMRQPGYKLSLVHKGEGGFELSKIGEYWRGHRGTGHDPRYKEHRRAYQPRTGWQG